MDLFLRCESNSGSQNITNSWYHDSINVTMPPYQLSTTWGANGILSRFDKVIMAIWVLFPVGGGDWAGSGGVETFVFHVWI